MEALQHRLTQYKGAPGQGSTVKCALNVHHAEIGKLIALVGVLQAQVAKLETALQPEAEEPEDLPVPVLAKPKPELHHSAVHAAEACPVLAVAAVVAPVVAAVLLPAVVAALSSKPAEEEPQVVGHYSVTASPASSAHGLPTPADLPKPLSLDNVQSVEEGSTDDSVEAILLEAEQHSADRFMSLAKHQQATTTKVRAAAARKRAATPRKKATP
jgi:hypothetical protein